MSDMLQLVVAISLHSSKNITGYVAVSIANLDDKLKHVGHKVDPALLSRLQRVIDSPL